MKTTFEMVRITENGKPAIKLLVRNTHFNKELENLLIELGYEPNALCAGKSIVARTPQELDAARAPIMKFFKKEAVNGVVEAI